ncbi:MAG: LysR family transcriptional regulator [Halanaerobacter sp.]
MIDYRLVSFISLAKLKNYTKTAEYLNLTQPTITQHIQYLENFYGVDLVIRTKRGIHLTAEGKLLLEYAQKIDSLAKGIKRRLENQKNIIKKYNIGATLTIGEYVLAKILGDYQEEKPNIDIALTVQNTETILKKLDREEIDLGLIEGSFDTTKYEHKSLKKDRLLLVLAPEHRLADRKSVDLKELLDEKFILRESGSGTRSSFEEAILEEGYNIKDLNVQMEIGNLNVIRTLVVENLGITVISQEVVKEELANNRLVSIPINGVDLEREFNFVYLSHYKSRDFIDEFIDFAIAKID